MRSPIAARIAIVLLSVLVASVGASPARAGVEPFPVSLVPAITVTEVDFVFTLDLYVDALAAQFNAYEVTLQWDPAILAFDGVTAGPLMFVQDCPPPFPIHSSTDSTVTYFITLLCADVSLDGPGVVSSYSFRALTEGTTPVEIVSVPDSSFYDAGLFIWPLHPTRPRQVSFTDAWVVVGTDPTDGPATASAGPAGLRIHPNPVRGATEMRFGTERPGPARLEILDVTGRRVFLRSWGALAAGEHREAWNGRGARGERLPAGVYVVRLRDGGGVRSGKITLIR